MLRRKWWGASGGDLNVIDAVRTGKTFDAYSAASSFRFSSGNIVSAYRLPNSR